MASHPDVDTQKMSAGLANISYDMFEVIPYLTRGGDGTASQLSQERADAVEQFHKWQEEEAKNKGVAENPNLQKKVPTGKE